METLKTLFDSYFDFHYGIGCAIGIGIFGSYLWWLRRQKKSRGQSVTKKEILCGLALSGYLVMILGGTLLNREVGTEYGAELTLFWSYRHYWEERHASMLWQMIYNVLAFIPWGILLPNMSMRMKKLPWVAGSAVIFSLFIELVQLIGKLGLFELDDIMHNVLGAVIGFGIWKCMKHFKRR